MSTTKVQSDMVDIDGATTATIVAGDKINFLDITDSLVKEDTVQGILDLVSGGFTQATEQATTSGTSFTFGSIPAGTTMIIISFEGVSLTSAVDIDVTIGDSGGLETSGYISRSADAAPAPGGAITSTAEFILWQNGTNVAVTGHMILTLKDADTFNWISSHVTADEQSGGGEFAHGAGSKSLSAELTQLKISGGTFDLGSVNIMYQ